MSNHSLATGMPQIAKARQRVNASTRQRVNASTPGARFPLGPGPESQAQEPRAVTLFLKVQDGKASFSLGNGPFLDLKKTVLDLKSGNLC